MIYGIVSRSTKDESHETYQDKVNGIDLNSDPMSHVTWRGEIDAGKTLSSGRLLMKVVRRTLGKRSTFVQGQEL